MLNGNTFLKMVKEPELNVEHVKSAKKKIVKPFKRTLEKFISVVTDNPGINRKGIIDATGYSNHCIDRCLNYSIESGELSRTLVRMSGPYEVYSYEINQLTQAS